MFVALDKLQHQGIKKAIVAVPEKFTEAGLNSFKEIMETINGDK